MIEILKTHSETSLNPRDMKKHWAQEDFM